MKRTMMTNYSVAVNWLNNNYVMCNKLPEIDESIYPNIIMPSDYAEDYDDDEEEDDDDYNDYDDNFPEIYQWFISNCSEHDVEYLQKTFGLIFSYSNLLDCYVLCVDHYGTSWDYVECETNNENAVRKLGQKK